MRAARLAAIVALALVVSACAASRVERAERDTPNAWLIGQRLSAGPIPPRANAAALEKAASEGILVDGPGTWVSHGPRNIGGRITALAVDPTNANHVWIGAAAGGVFDSADGGVTWTPRFDGEPALSIGSIATDPTNGAIVYAGTGEDNGGGYSFDGDGIWKTTNGGATWTNLGLAETRRIGKIAIDPTNGNRIFVAAGGNWFEKDANRGIYRSLDGGATWTKVLYVADDTGGIDLAIDPSNPNRIYAAMWQRFSAGATWYVGGTSGGVWRSLDGGTTWTKLASGLPTGAVGRIGLAIAPSQPATVYALIINFDGNRLNGIYRSANSGDTWTKTSGSNTPLFFSSYSYYFSQVRVDPGNPNTLYCLDVQLLRSINGGASVNVIANSVHSDWHDLRVETGGRILAGTDGGFYKSTNSGTSWTHAGNLPISQLYDVSVDAQNPARRIAGLQDNNVQRTTTGGQDDWEAVIGGDGLQVEVDPVDGNKVYGESQYGDIDRSTDGGTTFVSAIAGINTSERVNWNAPITVDPVTPATLYTGTVRVYRSIDAAQNWVAVSPNLTNGTDFIDSDEGTIVNGGNDWRRRFLDHLQDLIRHTVTVVSVSPVDHNVLWAGTDDGNVWVSSNSGTSWTKVNPPGAPYWITDIAPDEHDAQTAFLTVTGYRQGDKLPYLRVTRDLGQTWTDLSAGLPELPLNTVAADTAWRGRLFVGNDVGVHWSDDGGVTWSILRGGMPSVVVMELNERPGGTTLWAGTHARGIYAYDLAQLPAVADGDGDGVDNNADCALGDAGAFAAPGVVPTLSADKGALDATALSWSSLAAQAGAGTLYDVARGDLATLATSGTPGATSLACAVAGTTASDGAVPAPDSGVYYLVRGRNVCGLGSWGTDSAGAPRVLTACP